MKRKVNEERRGEVEKILIELSGMEQKALFEKYQTDWMNTAETSLISVRKRALPYVLRTR